MNYILIDEKNRKGFIYADAKSLVKILEVSTRTLGRWFDEEEKVRRDGLKGSEGIQNIKSLFIRRKDFIIIKSPIIIISERGRASPGRYQPDDRKRY